MILSKWRRNQNQNNDNEFENEYKIHDGHEFENGEIVLIIHSMNPQEAGNQEDETEETRITRWKDPAEEDQDPKVVAEEATKIAAMIPDTLMTMSKKHIANKTMYETIAIRAERINIVRPEGGRIM